MTVKFYNKYLTLLRNAIILILCLGSTAFSIVDPQGSPWTHDIATWNLQEFPLDGNRTVNTMTLLIRDLEIDLIAVQEITSENSFETLAGNIDGWEGVLCPQDNALQLGILYNTETVAIGPVSAIFQDDWYEFPRAPMIVPVTMMEMGDTLRFTLVVNHLKALGGQENIDRRRAACELLKSYIDSVRQGGGEERWLICGDLNDELDVPEEWNSFNAFLHDPQGYIFLTEEIMDDRRQASYPRSGSLIDHHLVTTQLRNEYTGGSIQTLRLGDEYPLYEQYVSDHRPVLVRFPGAVNSVNDEWRNSLPAEVNLSIYPLPSNGMVNIQFNLPKNRTGGLLRVRNVNGQIIDILPVDGNFGVKTWENESVGTGIYFVDLQGLNSQPAKIILLK
ncbi:hypothetical protein K8I28_12600 [bacterium]|nr:hypothetical protein [bacterium]